VTLLFVSAVAIDQQAQEAPIKRVIGLLEKMKSELQAEADKDASLYDKMVCWCTTTEKEKTVAIADAEQTIKDLQTEIEERSARFGELETEIPAMKKQIAKDTAALKEATATREKEAAAFRDEEKATVQAMTNLKNAIRVLGKVQLLQGGKGKLSSAEMTGIRVVLRDVMYQHELMKARSPKGVALVQESSMTAEARAEGQRALKTLVGTEDEELPLKFAERVLARSAGAASAAPTSFLQISRQPTNSGSYNSASGPIFGILTTMMDEFTADLKSSQEEEAKAVADFNAMEAAKTEQIKLGKEKLDELQAESAANKKGLSDAKENLQLTTDQRAADVEFLRNLKLTCNDLDAQWEARSKMRAEEITAVAETISILTSDDNAEQLKAGGVFAQGVSFVQTAEGAQRVLRSKVAAALRKAAGSSDFDSDDLLSAWRNRNGHSSPLGASSGPRAQLMALAVSAQLDKFTEIKAMMDKLVVDLKEQQKEEVTFKAYCIKELDTNEKDIFHKNEHKEDLDTKIKQLGAQMEKLAEEIGEANSQIATTKVEILKASQDREKENAQFQQVVSDQRATQGILNKALQRLKDFYAKRLSGFVQVDGQQTPPVHFQPMKKSAGASPVMGLVEQIIEDSVALEKEAIATEYQAQADYEKLVKDSNTLVKDLEDSVSEKSKESAQAAKDSNQATTDRDMAVDELESLAAYEADLHGQCDFVLKNFDIRQKARLQEMEAIGEAKAILSGSK
jgi:hypothetical protein